MLRVALSTFALLLILGVPGPLETSRLLRPRSWPLVTESWQRTPSLQRYEAVEPHMGTLVRITLHVRDQGEARAAFQAAFSRIRELDAMLSDYKPDSELSRLRHAAVGLAVPVSADLCRVLASAQDLAAATDGAFDVTQGPVIRLWRQARLSGRLPDEVALRDAAARSGYRKLHVDGDAQTVRLDAPGMLLDVGAIGKGYAASEALEVLTRRGVRSALVAVSGDLAFSDAPPGARGWRIAIHAGEASAGDVPAVLELANAAVSTAGPDEQHLDVAGRRYSHIVDPATRRGLTEDITVTVIAKHGLEADGFDTAASVLGARRGLALIESRADVAGLIVRRGKSGVSWLQSSRFRALADAHRGLNTDTGKRGTGA